MSGLIQGILFDLGSTLWTRGDGDQWLALEKAADARAGALLPRNTRSSDFAQVDDAILGAAIRQEIDRRIAHAHDDAPDEDPDFALIAQNVVTALSVSAVDYALGAAIFEALRIRNYQSRHLYDDALPTLHLLRERGYRLGIATNRDYGGAPFLDDLQRFGLLELVVPQAIAISADLGVHKPNPALFQYALAGLELTPAEAAMVGNNMVADVWGAQRLGLYSVWRPSPEYFATAQNAPGQTTNLVAVALEQAHARDPRTRTMTPPDAVITSLAELATLFPPL